MKFKLYVHPIEIESWNDKIIYATKKCGFDSSGFGIDCKKGEKGGKKGEKGGI